MNTLYPKLVSTMAIISLLTIQPSVFSQQTLSESISYDGMQREYIIYIPANYSGNTAFPLVLNFHGYGSSASQQMWYGDFRSIADTADFLIVHPQGTLLNGISHWNVGGWTIGSTVDDVGFIEALVDSLSADYSIDSTRVYATGMSNGGFMSFLLASQLSEKIAAIGSVAGSMTPETYNESNPLHPTPVLQFHGTADGVVPYNGAIWTLSVENALQYWVEYNHCNTLPSVFPLPDIDPNDGSTVEHIVYSDGDNEVNVEHFKVIGGEHTWPGSDFGGAGTNHDIDASEEIWTFFSRYDIYGLMGITDTETPDEESDKWIAYPNPAKGFMNIKLNFEHPVKYEIFSVQGKIVLDGNISSNHQQIDLSSLSSNIYILQIGNERQKILITE
ncbi:MAG: T9SS type A sorting domain-containing protein [Bacteroidetes bacterium]|nr:T9SS type A sorting domain-containing protein [Bacteroidota bacterium]